MTKKLETDDDLGILWSKVKAFRTINGLYYQYMSPNNIPFNTLDNMQETFLNAEVVIVGDFKDLNVLQQQMAEIFHLY